MRQIKYTVATPLAVVMGTAGYCLGAVCIGLESALRYFGVTVSDKTVDKVGETVAWLIETPRDWGNE